jgi:hypothetical protein
MLFKISVSDANQNNAKDLCNVKKFNASLYLMPTRNIECVCSCIEGEPTWCTF